MMQSDPVSRLKRGERPRAGRREQRVLAPDDIGRLLAAAAPLYRPLLATAVFTGLRLGELLGLRWHDVDLAGGVLHVRAQPDRRGDRVAPKTPQALRDVELMPSLVRTLRGTSWRARIRGRRPSLRERGRHAASLAERPGQGAGTRLPGGRALRRGEAEAAFP